MPARTLALTTCLAAALLAGCQQQHYLVHQDDAPLAILREVFADRKIVPLSGRHIAEGGGGIHCITQQIPAG